jgi:hypothetical protein
MLLWSGGSNNRRKACYWPGGRRPLSNDSTTLRHQKAELQTGWLLWGPWSHTARQMHKANPRLRRATGACTPYPLLVILPLPLVYSKIKLLPHPQAPASSYWGWPPCPLSPCQHSCLLGLLSARALTHLFLTSVPLCLLFPLPGMLFPCSCLDWLSPQSQLNYHFCFYLKGFQEFFNKHFIRSRSPSSTRSQQLLLTFIEQEICTQVMYWPIYLFTLCPHRHNGIVPAIFRLCFPSTQKGIRPRRHSVNVSGWTTVSDLSETSKVTTAECAFWLPNTPIP